MIMLGFNIIEKHYLCQKYIFPHKFLNTCIYNYILMIGIDIHYLENRKFIGICKTKMQFAKKHISI
jgi:hypothetical protein